MERATSRSRPRRRDDFIGVTSDGVWIPRPPKGPRNLTDKQVRAIVDGIQKRIRERTSSAHDA